MLEFIVSGSWTSTCLVGIVVGLAVYWIIQKWKYKYPPGPPGLPFIGKLLEMDPSQLHKQAFEWSKKYGSVITVRTVDLFSQGGKNNKFCHVFEFRIVKSVLRVPVHWAMTRLAESKDRLPGINDRPNLSYTEAVLHESMHMAPVVPLGIPHMTIYDTEVGGYTISKGTTININHWALHYDPEAWEKVERFIPERYLDESGKMGPKPKNWLPFSAGKRVCLGEYVAKPEL